MKVVLFSFKSRINNVIGQNFRQFDKNNQKFIIVLFSQNIK